MNPLMSCEGSLALVLLPTMTDKERRLVRRLVGCKLCLLQERLATFFTLEVVGFHSSMCVDVTLKKIFTAVGFELFLAVWTLFELFLVRVTVVTVLFSFPRWLATSKGWSIRAKCFEKHFVHSMHAMTKSHHPLTMTATSALATILYNLFAVLVNVLVVKDRLSTGVVAHKAYVVTGLRWGRVLLLTVSMEGCLPWEHLEAVRATEHCPAMQAALQEGVEHFLGQLLFSVLSCPKEWRNVSERRWVF